MKSKSKLNKLLSSILAIIVASSTISIPQNLILASQLADIEIIENTNEENIEQDISDEENSENIDQDISDEENSENIDQDISNEENSENIDQDISNEENSENIDQDISNEENSENIDQDISDEENSENIDEDISDEENSENIDQDISNEENSENIPIDENIQNINEIKEDETKNSSILDSIIVTNGVITGYNGSSAQIGDLTLPRMIKNQEVTAIADNAFINKGITKLTFADDSAITTIGNNAFENNPITEIKFSPSVTSIGNSSFKNCNKLVNLNTVNITRIGKEAFYSCSVESVEMPQVINIGEKAFVGCGNLVSVKIPEITNIGKEAFYSCKKLKSVEIPKATSIGNYAFGYSILESIEIPEATNIEENVFYNCNNLKEIRISNKNKNEMKNSEKAPWGSDAIVYWKDTKNDNGFIIDEGYHLQKYIGNSSSIVLPSHITEIGKFAFKDYTTLVSIEMPEVISIGFRAFYKCDNLVSAKMPKATKVERYAFNYCSSLSSVEMPQVTIIEEGMFDSCSSLVSIKIPQVTSVGDSAFFYCSSLSNVEMSQVTSIGNNAFIGCSNLKEIRLTNKAKDEVSGSENAPWESNAVVYWKNTINNNGFIIDDGYYLQKYIGNLESIILPDEVTEVSNKAFVNTSLKSIKMPNVTSIGYLMFSDCISLVNVEIPKVKTIDEQAFRGCYNLENIEMPEVISIGYESFYNCGLKTVKLPKIEKLDYGAFDACSSLESVELTSKNITSIGGSNVFPDNCVLKMPNHTKEEIDKIDADFNYPWGAKYVLYKGINIDSTDSFVFTTDGGIERYIGNKTEITIPEYLEIKGTKTSQKITHIKDYAFKGFFITSVSMPKIESIGNYAFQYSNGLISIEMPEVKTIGNYAFQNCENLKSVEMSKVESIGSYAFNDCRYLKSIQSPNLISIKDYAFNGCSSLESIEMPKVESIGYCTFQNCGNLKNLEFPELIIIGGSSFDGCSSLESIEIPKVESIGDYTFKNCRNLKSIDISNLTKIGTDFFYGCSSLTSVKMSNIETISYSVFDGCTSLESITIPKTTKTIYSSAFRNTPNLKAIYVEQYVKASTDKGQNYDGVIPQGQDPSVPIYYLGQFIKIDTNVTRKDANEFNINVVYNGYGEVLTEIKATDKNDETQNLNDREERNYVYDIQDLTKLSDKEYKFTGSGQFKNSPSNLSKTFSESTYIKGFVNYIDTSGNHLKDVPADTKHYTKGEEITLTSAQPQGQGLFLGWSLTPNGTSSDVISTVKMNDTNINLYPVFDANAVKATLTLNYGYPKDKPKTEVISTYVGVKYNLPTIQDDTNLNRKGYKFINWTDGSNQFNTTIDITSDTTLYANWEQKDVTINYHLNDGTMAGSSNDIFSETVKFEDSYTLKTATKSGYNLDGWYKEKELINKVTNLWDSIEDNGQDTLTIDVYAKWNKKNTPPSPDTSGTTTESSTESTSQTVSESNTESTSQTVSESSTESTSQTVSESSTESTSQTVSESSTESTSQTVSENSTESTSQTVPGGNNTENTSVDNQTETTTNDNQVTPPIIDGGNNNDNNGGNNNELDNNTEENVNVQIPDNNVYTFGNLEVITPEYEELARQAIQNIVPDREAIDTSIDNILENASNNGAQINERRLTEKPAFGFGAEGNISLLIILLLILILIIIAYIVKKQIIDKEKNKNEEDDDEKDNSSLTV